LNVFRSNEEGGKEGAGIRRGRGVEEEEADSTRRVWWTDGSGGSRGLSEHEWKRWSVKSK
jgi:hypothetical protein